jgi:hypothetical protein
VRNLALHLFFGVLVCTPFILPFVKPNETQAQTLGGYILREDGYYWKGGVAYIGKKVLKPLRPGYAQEYYMQYTLAPVTPQTYPYTADWRSALLPVFKEVHRVKAAANIFAIDNDAMVKTMEKINEASGSTTLTGQLGHLQYGLGLPFQGLTAYGPSQYGNYSVNRQVFQFATTFDPNVAMAGNLALAKLVQTNAAEIAKSNMELTAIAFDHMARIALAQGPGYSAKASTGVGLGGGTMKQTGSSSSVQLLFNSSCIECHSGSKPGGNLVLTDANAIPLVAWDKILDRIEPELSADDRMPRGKPALSKDQRDIIKASVRAAKAKVTNP